jgi:hypothetical protein
MKMYRVIFLIFIFLSFSCNNNKKEQSNVFEDVIIDTKIFNEELKIHLIGSSIVWSKAKYEFKIETIENSYFLLVTQQSPDNIKKSYYRTLSNIEAYNN